MKLACLSFLIVMVAFCNNIRLMAQNEIAGIKEINLAYQNYSSLSMDITYKVFENWNSVKPFQTEKGNLKRTGKMTVLQISTMEFIQNTKYSVVVDHEEKTIGIFGIYGNLPDADYNNILAGIEKALKYCKEVKHKILANNRGQYDIVFPDGMSEYKKVSLIYDEATKLLQNVELYYSQVQELIADKKTESLPRLEITYTNIKTQVNFDSDLFTYNAFLKNSGKNLVCNEKYKYYELIDKYSQVKK